jgi:heavy metal translocating P-type ATPase
MHAASINRKKGPAVVCRDAAKCDDLDLRLSKMWLRIAIAGVFAGQGMMFSLALNMTPPAYGSTAYWILHGGLIFSSLVVMAFLGGPLFVSTWNMLRRRRLSIEGLFTLSLVGAFTGSVVGSVSGRGDVFYEVVAVVIAIYTFGRILSERSTARLQMESARLRERFDHAKIRDAGGAWQRVSLSEVSVGATVRIEPGEAITVDGAVVEGEGYVQETALSGEPLPVVKRAGDYVRAGTHTIDCRLEVEVQQTKGQREIDSIIGIVESTDGRPSELQTQANALIQKFLPLVVGVSLTTFVFWFFAGIWIDAVLNSMAVLLVACPCALGLATPVAISQGLYRLARLGLVSRDGALIDVLAHTRNVFFDKTGTLSEGHLRVTETCFVEALPISREALLASIHHVESPLNHPVAQGLSRYIESLNLELREELGSNLRLIPGQGLEFKLGDMKVQVGEGSLAERADDLKALTGQVRERTGKRVFVFIDGRGVVCFVLRERLRDGVGEIWPRLQGLGLKMKVLTGDPDPQLALPPGVELRSGLRAEEKVAEVMRSNESGERPIFVGDGINDAAAMSVARGSIVMDSGARLPSSVAMGRLRGDSIAILPECISLARSIHSRLRGNLIFAVSYNVVGISLAAIGLLHPIAAAFIMIVSSFLVTFRALGLQRE